MAAAWGALVVWVFRRPEGAEAERRHCSRAAWAGALASVFVLQAAMFGMCAVLAAAQVSGALRVGVLAAVVGLVIAGSVLPRRWWTVLALAFAAGAH